MIHSTIRRTLLVAAASLGLAGCMGSDGYGYGGGLTYGSGYYDRGYYGGGSPYYGWYDNYYYPGAGSYVYDRNGGRRAWNDGQRRYWEGRNLSRGDRRELRENWQGFRSDRRDDRAQFRADRQQNREALRSGQVTREQFRAERQRDRSDARQQRLDRWRDLGRENRRDLRN